jgi:hypothetical protein
MLSWYCPPSILKVSSLLRKLVPSEEGMFSEEEFCAVLIELSMTGK